MRRLSVASETTGHLSRLKRGDVAISRLFHNALGCIDEIEWLMSMDDETFGGAWRGGRWTPGSPEMPYAWAANRAHARWAAVTAYSMVDVCAATVGRIRGIGAPPHEAGFSALQKKAGKLGPFWKAWVDSVAADPNYRLVTEARHPFVHKGYVEIGGISGPPSGHAQRSRFAFAPVDVSTTDLYVTNQVQERPAREIVEMAHRCAIDSFELFMQTARDAAAALTT